MRRIQGIPPGQVGKFFPESAFSPGQLQAGLAADAIQFWKTAADGERWYQVFESTSEPPKQHEQKHRDMIFAAHDDDAADDDVDDEVEINADRAAWRYKKIVEARAMGHDVGWMFVAEVLADAGKTQDDFDADVAEIENVLRETEDMDDSDAE
jgi:hypothetical protein